MKLSSLASKLKGRPARVLGLDVGSHSIKLVELVESGGGLVLRRVGKALLPPGAIADGSIQDRDEVMESLTALLGNLQPKTRRAATSIAGYSVIVKRITVPYATEREIEDNLVAEAENYVPFEIEDVYVDFYILRSPGEGEKPESEIFLVAAKKEVVDDYATVIQDVGLTPAVVDVDAFAMGNAFENAYGKVAEAVALVDIGASKTNLNVVAKGQSLFARDMAFGGRQLTEAIMEATGLDYPEAERLKISGTNDAALQSEAASVCQRVCRAWGAEIRKAVDFFVANAQAEEKPTRILLSGGTALMQGLDRFLGQEAKLPVQVFEPWRNISAEKGVDARYLAAVGPQMAIATGLALRTADL
ncbi:type IV pilus assembly protein PilM [Dissulfurirhabdus thermomarina]|uniref:Type IV pilus assembly protein PilM n=1 Tax=Dissulfurirhabdus thermomarina TaxID=1765737 RepID=A0A6N9TXK6_DISTH|nr:type IV pilus assembly protein PilM [Dissulfurirhabdus thermomarina]NDY43206.1 type IV pilus assembly protein PilM [Dissulfurirhabdus thermomarina]NMX22446.1 type IV pilus assembly protein PilM [Dissulfurirhabdus thermomarina]